MVDGEAADGSGAHIYAQDVRHLVSLRQREKETAHGSLTQLATAVSALTNTH